MLDFASNPSLKNKSYGWGSRKQNLKVKTNMRGRKIAQQVNVTATKSGDPSLTWGGLHGSRENCLFLQVVL